MLSLFLALAWMWAVGTPAAPRSVVEYQLFARTNLVAWCIVPFDAKQRGPAERAEMVARLGFHKVAYDWREPHVPTFEEEILEYQKHGLEYFAFWSIHDKAFELFAKHGLHPQVWLTAPSPAAPTREEQVRQAAAELLPAVERTRRAGCRLGLYNHDGWGGEPENLVAVCEYLRRHHDASHVGIVYNFHHGHAHIDDFARSFTRMEPYLLCLNINGMVRDGDKHGKLIVTLAQGDHELAMLRVVAQSGWRGPIGILCHREDADAELVLADNLEGLDWLKQELTKPGSGGPRPKPRAVSAPPRTNAPPPFHLRLDVITEGYDGKTSWFHPRAGALPGTTPTIVLTMQKLNLKRSDVFYPIASLESSDLGRTWSPIVEHTQTLGRHPFGSNCEEGICDFTPKWHAPSGKLIATGHTVIYSNDVLVVTRPRRTAWSVYDPKMRTWTPWAKLAMPAEPKFSCGGAGSTQRVDLDNGDILLPIYSKEIKEKAYFSTVVRARLDGEKLRYLEHGTELTINVDRGLYEPSLAKFKGRFYLTMRNDRAAYVAVSQDGLHFGEPRKWTFDDGADLGSYNTQAHWVTHQDGLFLVYTRRGANNDNVVRHRAPLFMARIDPGQLVVVRATERELVPNKGAQLGNFAVMDVNAQETWVTTSEGMRPGAPSKSGANGRVYAARILWATPNEVWNRH
jgi:hypothetical protein